MLGVIENRFNAQGSFFGGVVRRHNNNWRRSMNKKLLGLFYGADVVDGHDDFFTLLQEVGDPFD